MSEQSTSKGFAILSAATIAVKLLSVIYMPLLLKIIGGNTPFAIYNVLLIRTAYKTHEL